MINFDRNTELDIAMENILISMINVDDYITAILNYTEKFLTPKKEKELIEILKKYNVPHDKIKFSLKALNENPYYRDIKLDDSVYSGTVRYEKATIKKRTLMNTNFFKPLGKYLFHYHPIGYFDTDIDLPVLKEGSKVWMSPAISEIASMGDGIEKGHGKCLTMGLGIGVLPYLWLLKDEVECVTVVELNQDVIDLFKKYILPQFKTKKKLEIIQGNAIEYYNEKFLSQFDYVYVDFWESNEDGLKMYIKLMEKNINFPYIDYWIEDSILCDVKYIVAMYLFTLYQGKSVTDFISSMDADSKELAKKTNLYFKTKNDIIKTEDELLNIIHNKDILRGILSY